MRVRLDPCYLDFDREGVRVRRMLTFRCCAAAFGPVGCADHHVGSLRAQDALRSELARETVTLSNKL